MREASAGTQEAPGHGRGPLCERGLNRSSGPAPCLFTDPSLNPSSGYSNRSRSIQVGWGVVSLDPKPEEWKITLVPTSTPSREDFSPCLRPQLSPPLWGVHMGQATQITSPAHALGPGGGKGAPELTTLVHTHSNRSFGSSFPHAWPLRGTKLPHAHS